MASSPWNSDPHTMGNITNRRGLAREDVRVVWQSGEHEVSDWLMALPDRFDEVGTVIYEARNVVKRMELPDGTRVVVKRYKRPVFLQRLVYSFLRPSKGLRACNNALELRRRGVDTPSPIACVEQRMCGVYQRGWFVYRYHEGTPFAQLDMRDRALLDGFAAYAARLHSAGVIDRDFNVGNILCNRIDGRWSFTLIDINRMKFIPYGRTPRMTDCIGTLLVFPHSMDFRYFMERYLTERGQFSDDRLATVMRQKERHDRRYRMRKRLRHPLRRSSLQCGL